MGVHRRSTAVQTAILSVELLPSSESRIAARFANARSITGPMAATDLDVFRTSTKSLVPIVTEARLMPAPSVTWAARPVCWPCAIRLVVVALD